MTYLLQSWRDRKTISDRLTLQGTNIAAGKARGVVIGTGLETAIGKCGQLLNCLPVAVDNLQNLNGMLS